MADFERHSSNIAHSAVAAVTGPISDTKTQLELYNQASNIVRAKYSEMKDQVQLIGAFRSAALEDGQALQKQMEQVIQLEKAISALERAAADMDKQTKQVESLAQSLPLVHLAELRATAADPPGAAAVESAAAPAHAVPTGEDAPDEAPAVDSASAPSTASEEVPAGQDL